MTEQQRAIGGALTLGTETPQQDVIDGWNFKVQGAVEGDIGSQALELDGLVPFVQLIGLYDKAEIDRLLGRETSTLGITRTAVFAGEDKIWSDYKEDTEEDVRDFEDQIKKNYIKVFLVNENMKEGEGIPKDGIILATNSPQVGNEAFEVINDVGTSKDAGGVGITDLQIETGTKDFLNRRYKLRMTITDPQVLNDRPEYIKLATLQSMFLIIHGWSNPDQLTAWPEQFSPAPVVTDVGSAEFPNGRMIVDMSHNNTGGAWGAALVATTMYDFAFNEIGQLEANFTFMPREITFMNTMRIPVVAPIIQQILNTGEQNEPFDEKNPEPKPKSFAGYAKGVGDVISEFGKNLAQVIAEEQAAYIGAGDRNPLSSIFENISNQTDFSLTDKLAQYSEQADNWGEAAHTIGDYYDQQKRQQAYARFPHAGVGIGTFMNEPMEVPGPEGADPATTTYTHYTQRIDYYYLGWILEALRFSLWDLNKGKASRGETPFDLKFRYMGVPRNSPLNYAIQDQLTASIIPSINSYTAEAVKYLELNCLPSKGTLIDPPRSILKVSSYQIFRVITRSDVSNDRAGSEPTFLQACGYELLESMGAISEAAGTVTTTTSAMGTSDTQRFLDFKKAWASLTRQEKLAHIPNGDYRKSLVEDPDVNPNPINSIDRGLRIMHPDFENQLLYNVVPIFDEAAWNRFSAYQRRLWPPGINIVNEKGGATISEEVWKLIVAGSANGNMTNAVDGFLTHEPRHQPVQHRQTRPTPGQGFWYQRNGQYVGEGIFGWRDSRGPGGRTGTGTAWQSMLGTTEGFRNGGDETYMRGNEWRESDPAGYNTSAYGILMPAVSARFFAIDKYRLLQHEWYNDHIEYLSNNFSKIIKKRIEEAISQGQQLSDIAEEPVDLFWLTGKKYNHALTLYSPLDLQLKAPDIVFTSNTIEITRLQKNIDSLTVERSSIANQLGAEGDVGPAANAQADRRRPQAEARLENATTQFLNQPYNKSRFDALNSAEDIVANSIYSLYSKKEFWKSRIKLILIELVSKDLIKMRNARFIQARGGHASLDETGEGPQPEYTITSAFAAPITIRSLPTTLQTSTARHWIKTAVKQPPQQIPIDVFEGITFLEFYEVAIVMDRVISEDGEIFSSTAVRPQNMSYAKRFDEAGINVIETNYTIPHNWAGLKEDGAARYVNWYFRPNDNYYVGLSGGRVDGNTAWTEINGTTDYSADIVIDRIGAFEEELSAYSLARRQQREEVPEEETKSKSRNAYIFMNWVPQSMRNTYALPEEMIIDLTSNYKKRAWNVANDRFDQYISNCRALLKKYVSKNKSIDEKIIPLETNKDRIAAEISRSQSTLDSFQQSLNILMGIGSISPFGANTKFDTNITVPLGGGREMKLRGNRAQYYAARWNKKLVFGANDIQNYGPPPGGLPYRDPMATNYGWKNMALPSETHNFQDYVNLATGELNFYSANLTYSRGPIQIASLIDHEGNVETGTSLAQSAVVGLPRGSSFWSGDRGRTVAQFAEAGQINEGELNVMFSHKYGKEITISDPFINTKLITNRSWPTYVDVGHDVNPHQATPEPAVERWALYIDDDLDFIVPKEHLRRAAWAVENDNFLDTSPNNWQKLPWRFMPEGDPIMIYPRATGARISINEHLPNLTEAVVRQLVRTEYNGFSNGPAKQHNINPTFPNNGSPPSSMGDSASNFAGNPRLAYIGEDNSKIYQSQLDSLQKYTTAGRHPATSDWPFGVPSDIFAEDAEVTTEHGRNVDDLYPELDPDISYMESIGFTEPIGGQFTFQDGQLVWVRSASRPELSAELGVPEKSSVITSLPSGQCSGSFRVRSTGNDIFSILMTLPPEFEEGFMSSIAGADEDFGGGEPLNPGVRRWITNYLINLLPQGRRIGRYAATNSGLIGTAHKVRDVVYGDLFDAIPDAAANNSVADFTNKTIVNVAEIPIKRAVVDNLLDKKNTNMSIMQFVQQLITPSSIGVAGNVQIAGRNRNGIMELAVASIDYRGMSYDLIKESEDATMNNRQPNNQLLFDYKRRNSLIESIDMSSKMDPAAFLTYQNSSSMIAGPGRDYNILKLLQYEGIAEDFKEYLEGVSQTNNAGISYSGIVHVGIGNRVTVDRVRYNQISPTILDGFVAQNPERWAKISSMMQGQNNHTTDLLAFYMRSVTLTIHGLTNVEPFNLINVKGVLPSLEGIYIVTNVTDRVTPAGFQTILEGKLIRRAEKNETSGPARNEQVDRGLPAAQPVSQQDQLSTQPPMGYPAIPVVAEPGDIPVKAVKRHDVSSSEQYEESSTTRAAPLEK